jgi:hypothetical protein
LSTKIGFVRARGFVSELQVASSCSAMMTSVRDGVAFVLYY